MEKADIERLRKYCAGYRMLMKGGLDSQIHTASTSVSELSEDQFAYVDVADLEALLDIAESIQDLIDRMESAIVKLKDLAEEDWKSSNELSRIEGKIEGVKLAISYAREIR